MTPTNRGKRPSARPAARAGAASPPAGEQASGAKGAGRKGAAEPDPSVDEKARSDTAKPVRQGAPRARARVSARRETPAAKGAPAEPGRSSAKEASSGGVSAGARKRGRNPDPRAAAAEPSKRRARGARSVDQAKSKPKGPPPPAALPDKPSAKVQATPVTEAEQVPVEPARKAVVVSLPTQGPSVPPPGDRPAEGDDIWTADGAPPVLPELRTEEAVAAGEPAPPAVGVARLLAGDRRIEEADSTGAQAILDVDYYERQYGARSPRSPCADVDEFGLDPHSEERARPYLEALCKHYFRAQVDGASHVPEAGPALLVANRSGALPWDGLILRTALRMGRPELPALRWLSEDSVIHYPFLGVFLNRLGAVRACPENAERLLAQRRLVAVFPEGAQGSNKLFRDRYRLQRFGRGGYVRLALKHGAPIVPTAIVGAEETNPVLARSRFLGKALGAEFLPLTPTFPWLGPVGLLPAPVKWRFVVGEPIDLSGYGPDAADDALVVHRLNEQVRSILQSLLEQATKSRRSVLFG